MHVFNSGRRAVGHTCTSLLGTFVTGITKGADYYLGLAVVVGVHVFLNWNSWHSDFCCGSPTQQDETDNNLQYIALEAN
jgi:hypothetical protein